MTRAADLLKEGKEFEDSAVATDFIVDMAQLAKKLDKMANDPRILAWAKITDSNFGTSTLNTLKNLIKASKGAKANATKFEDEMFTAGE